MFKYLYFEAQQSGQTRGLVRALNYAPYVSDLEEQIVLWLREELEATNFFRAGGALKTLGGGTMTLNCYYETITLFGASGSHGVEENREAVARLLEGSFPDHEVAWFSLETEEADKVGSDSQAKT
jgi:hypothetical protein